MLSLLSNFGSRTIRTKTQLPWLSTRTTVFMCSWHIWHIVGDKLWRRKTTRTYYRFWKSRWNNELRCIGFGWLRSPISINQESEDNIELLPLHHVPCVTLCTLSLLLSNNTHETTKKKKKKKKKGCQMWDVSVPQSWPRWAHSLSHTRVTVERGIKFGIDQNRDAAANCWRLAPWLMPAARRRHPRFLAIFDRLFVRLPARISTSDLHLWILRKKIVHIRAYDFGVQFSFNLIYLKLD